MKQLLMAAAIVAAGVTAVTTPAFAADVSGSISIGEPGFYGRIDLGGYPQPEVIYRQPMMVERVENDRPPVYLRVPPGHARHWRQHCGEYNACGERVMFVRDNWYNREYAPRYREQHRDHGNDHHDGNNHGDHGNDHHGDNGDHGHGHDH